MRVVTQLCVSWLANAIVLAIVAWLFADIDSGTTGQLLAAAAIFGVLNTVLKPVLKLLTLPFAVITLGLVWFGVSMLMLWLTDALVPGFDINGGWTLVWVYSFTDYNNFGHAVLKSSGASSATALSHTLTIANLVRAGTSAACDRIDLIAWRYTADSSTGSLQVDTTTLLTFGAREESGRVELCSN